MVERSPEKAGVGSSILPPGTRSENTMVDAGINLKSVFPEATRKNASTNVSPGKIAQNLDLRRWTTTLNF